MRFTLYLKLLSPSIILILYICYISLSRKLESAVDNEIHLVVDSTIHQNLAYNNVMCTTSDCTKVNSTQQKYSTETLTYTPPLFVKKWLHTNKPLLNVTRVGFIINPEQLCKTTQPIDYVMLVESATSNFARRRAIRETYGRQDLFSNVTQKVAFLLGTTQDVMTSQHIREEAAQFNDVIQGDFIDSYYNLTLKGLVGFHWVSEFCHRVKVVLKLDDDVLVNVFRFANKVLPLFSEKRHKIGCKLWLNGTSKIHRGDMKHGVVGSEFKGLDTYPFDYCWGFFVVMTADLIRPILEAAKVTPYFWIEDVYLFGLLPLTIRDISRVNFGQNLTSYYAPSKKCLRNNKRGHCEYFVFKAGHREVDKTKDFYSLWSLL